jgi:hypothetical protein
MELYTYLQQYVQCNIRKIGWEMGDRQKERRNIMPKEKQEQQVCTFLPHNAVVVSHCKITTQ